MITNAYAMYAFEPIYKSPFVFTAHHTTPCTHAPERNNNRRHFGLLKVVSVLCWLVLFTCSGLLVNATHMCGCVRGAQGIQTTRQNQLIQFYLCCNRAGNEYRNTVSPFRLCNPPRYLTPNTHSHSHSNIFSRK